MNICVISFVHDPKAVSGGDTDESRWPGAPNFLKRGMQPKITPVTNGKRCLARTRYKIFFVGTCRVLALCRFKHELPPLVELSLQLCAHRKPREPWICDTSGDYPPSRPSRVRSPDFLMAFVFRRWRILLVLNVLAVAGFMTFWAKCNTRNVQTAGPEAAADSKRPRGNGTAQGPSISHEVLLKRLSSLEDVVYRQLNGKEQQQSKM